MRNVIFGICLAPLLVGMWLLFFIAVNDHAIDYQECGGYCEQSEIDR